MNSSLPQSTIGRIRNLAILLALGTALTVQAGNPQVIPVQSHVKGKTYGEWGAAFWQWVMSIPADRSPLTDPTGQFASENQSGPVWFLSGSSGGSADRSSTIPAGKLIFAPIYTWIFGSGVFDCHPSVPGVSCDVDSLRASAAAAVDTAEVVECWIDGVPVENIEDYRATSPVPFPITYPENSLLGLPAGTYDPQVTDGYWLMLHPLTPGVHVLRFHVHAPDVGVSFLINHTVTVQ
jgi:hypothetical protein